ncbi:hypothetical protein BCR34DRAFT_613933 [Clohesyomyces aquaticus]|uniref:Uncharacterized protein n=1 Tax=Clohesyomyces aquaticus TaxID=1231657 RepID=A0A1Y1ZQI4_9PLEO|nr:hypothetical protein BCR34DRAFT_613933 [Clohesyomyces aquaticus]
MFSSDWKKALGIAAFAIAISSGKVLAALKDPSPPPQRVDVTFAPHRTATGAKFPTTIIIIIIIIIMCNRFRNFSSFDRLRSTNKLLPHALQQLARVLYTDHSHPAGAQHHVAHAVIAVMNSPHRPQTAHSEWSIRTVEPSPPNPLSKTGNTRGIRFSPPIPRPKGGDFSAFSFEDGGNNVSAAASPGSDPISAPGSTPTPGPVHGEDGVHKGEAIKSTSSYMPKKSTAEAVRGNALTASPSNAGIGASIVRPKHIPKARLPRRHPSYTSLAFEDGGANNVVPVPNPKQQGHIKKPVVIRKPVLAHISYQGNNQAKDKAAKGPERKKLRSSGKIIVSHMKSPFTSPELRVNEEEVHEFDKGSPGPTIRGHPDPLRSNPVRFSEFEGIVPARVQVDHYDRERAETPTPMAPKERAERYNPLPGVDREANGTRSEAQGKGHENKLREAEKLRALEMEKADKKKGCGCCVVM